GQTEQLRDQKEFAQHVKARAIEKSGVDPTKITKLHADLDKRLVKSDLRPSEITRKAYLEGEAAIRLKGVYDPYSTGYVSFLKSLTENQRKYYTVYKRWLRDLTEEERDQTAKFDEALQMTQLEAIMTQGILFDKADDQGRIKRIVEGRQTNVGVIVFKKGQKDPVKAEILDDPEKMGDITSIGAVIPVPGSDSVDIIVKRETGEYTYRMRMDEMGDYFAASIRDMIRSGKDPSGRREAILVGFEERTASAKISDLKPGESSIFRDNNGDPVFQIVMTEVGNYEMRDPEGNLIETEEGDNRVPEFASSSQAAVAAGRYRRRIVSGQ
ncbi:hypothetical protein LCGC14_2107050, partial [marine sediment metagenome]